MTAGEILLLLIVILVPLVIAVAVTIWTLQPAVLRNERAKRAQRRTSQAAESPPATPSEAPPTAE